MSEMAPPMGAHPRQERPEGPQSAAARELELARRMMERGDYSQVIPRLMHIITKNPDTEAAKDARYYLGIAYYEIGGLSDAREHFREYVLIAPTGKYEREARDYMAQLREDAQQLRQPPEQLDAAIVEARTRLEEDPEDLAYQLELADLHWKRQQYEEAGILYSRILGKWPQLAQDVTIRKRIAQGPDGAWVLLTPEEILRQHAESEPLVVYNTSWFRSGRFSGWPATSEEQYYNVTGQALNRGNQTLRNAHLIVTIYGFGDLVYDTQTVPLGTLAPGAKRPFSVRFSNFDNIENVERYEVQPLYDQ